MLESQNPQNHADRQGEPRSTPDEARLTDREVPLPGTEALGSTPAAIHAWLDGEGTEADARSADAAQAALWSRISEETTARRRVAAPANLQARIMDALPAAAPAAAMATSTAKATSTATHATAATDGRIALSPFVAAVAATGLIALGYLLAKTLG